MTDHEHEDGAREPDARARKHRRRRRLAMRLIPLIRILVRTLWATLRIERIGVENASGLVEKGEPFIPCYWHGRQFVCVKIMLELQKKGLKTGFLISPSRDGEIAARLLETLDVHVIRGSSTRTGAQAMRDLYRAITIDRISPITTPDGPKGPIFVFKPGAVMMAKLSGAPIVPMNYAASKTWQLGSWDRFQIPRPFARVVVAVGEPRAIPKSISDDEIEDVCREMERTLADLERVARDRLVSRTPNAGN